MEWRGSVWPIKGTEWRQQSGVEEQMESFGHWIGELKESICYC